MAGCGCASTCSPSKKVSPRFRKALWIALVINALMFVVEILGGYKAQSVSLWADALDFAGDAAKLCIIFYRPFDEFILACNSGIS